MSEVKTYQVLSIDAWRYDGGWNWNNWFNCSPRCPSDIVDNNRKLINWFRKNGLLNEGSAGKIAVDDDQYNKVIIDKNTREPLFAVVYGEDS